MTKVRQDAWSHEDDVLLAQTVLKHIKDGGTQLKAFDEIGDILNRTSAACGFRWNAEVRDKYEEEVQLAKKQRKEKKRQLVQLENPKAIKTTDPASTTLPQTDLINNIQPTPSTPITLADVIAFLQELNKEKTHSTYQLAVENNRLLAEQRTLQKEHESLLQKYNNLLQQQTSIQEDYQSLMNIMNRASKMIHSEEDKTSASTMAPIFQMDQNGKIEIIGPGM